LLSVAAVAGGLVIGMAFTWLVVLGVAGAQVILVAVAARSLYRR